MNGTNLLRFKPWMKDKEDSISVVLNRGAAKFVFPVKLMNI